MDADEVRKHAAALLGALWHGVPADYKSRYRRNIWQQFEDNVRSAAYTSSLSRFVNNIAVKMAIEVGKSQADREAIENVLNMGQDRAILKTLRDETSVVVLMVRLANQERRRAYERKVREEAGDDEGLFA